MRFEDRTNTAAVREAIYKAENLFASDSKMMSEIFHKNDFAFNSGNGEQVFLKIVNCKAVAPVHFYKHWNPLSKVMGYSDMKAIYFNSRKFYGFSYEDIIGLLCHEWLHIAGFSHGNNYPSDFKNKHSVNYFVSQNIKRWL